MPKPLLTNACRYLQVADSAVNSEGTRVTMIIIRTSLGSERIEVLSLTAAGDDCNSVNIVVTEGYCDFIWSQYTYWLVLSRRTDMSWLQNNISIHVGRDSCDTNPLNSSQLVASSHLGTCAGMCGYSS